MWGQQFSCCLQRGSVASLCARSRGEPSSAHCEQRLSERLTPCPCDPVCAYVLNGFFTRCRRKRVAGLRRLRAEVVARPPASSGESPHAHTKTEKKTPRISACAPTRSAASRDGMAGWAGEGGGRFGERREYEAPTLPSTPRQHGMARHHKRQPRSGSAPSKNRLVTTPASRETARHHTSQTRNGTPPHTSAEKPHRQPQNTCLVKMRIAGQTMHTVKVYTHGYSFPHCGH